MAEQPAEESEDRRKKPEPADDADAGRLDHRGADLEPGEGRMSRARTGRFGGAHEDPAGQYPGFTPEGRSGT